MVESGRTEELAVSYQAISRFLGALEDKDWLRATRCRGWAVCDLVYHLLHDAQRALVAFSTPAEGPADVDFVSYWRPFSSDDPASSAHARFVRIIASAHSSPLQIANRWYGTSVAAVRAAEAAPADGFISTQGHVLAVPDFIATLVVEAVIHHLDLIVDLPGAEGPEPAALALVRATLDGLVGQRLPVEWDDTTYALKATGREALTKYEREALGAVADRLPIFS